MIFEEYNSLEVMQQKVKIQDNMSIIKSASGAMDNYLKNIKYLKPLLNYLQRKQLQQLKYKMTDDVVFRVTLFDIKLNAFNGTKTKPSDETIKHLLRLLILSESIERVGFDELSDSWQKTYNNYSLVVFQSMNMIYRINDLRHAKFERLKGLGEKRFNYTILSLFFDEKIANKVFKEFTPHNEHYLITEQSMADVVDYVKEHKSVDLESVSVWQNKQFIKPYDPIRNDLKVGNNTKFYIETYKNLNNFKYWGKQKIKLLKNSEAKNKIKGLHGSKLILTTK